jgi:hypothetical protein
LDQKGRDKNKLTIPSALLANQCIKAAQIASSSDGLGTESGTEIVEGLHSDTINNTEDINREF